MASKDEDDVKGLKQCFAHFTQQTAWIPQHTHHVAGAFRYSSYDFLKRWAMKYIAYRKGCPTDTTVDYELTDCDDLARFIDTFLHNSESGRTAPRT